MTNKYKIRWILNAIRLGKRGKRSISSTKTKVSRLKRLTWLAADLYDPEGWLLW